MSLPKKFGSLITVGVPEASYKDEVSIYLPHSCDEWVVGNPEEARQLAKELNEAADYLEELKKTNEIPK